MGIEGASCQWSCSGDHTFPGGAAPCGRGCNSFNTELGVLDVGIEGASCQWLCSTDHTLFGGAGSIGDDNLFGVTAGSDS